MNNFESELSERSERFEGNEMLEVVKEPVFIKKIAKIEILGLVEGF